MRSTGLLLLVGIWVAACSSDSTPTVYVSLAYQVRCLTCEPRGPDDAARSVKVVDGEDGYKLDCAVQRVNGVRRVTFSVSHIDAAQSSTNHVFTVSSGNLDSDDTELQCEVRVIEGANTYEGTCSGLPPEESGGPCQATFSEKAGVISGGVYCSSISNALSATRYVVAPGSRTEAAKFEIHGCPGL